MNLECATIVAHCLTTEKTIARMRDGVDTYTQFLNVVDSIKRPEESALVFASDKLIRNTHAIHLTQASKIKKPGQQMKVDLLAVLHSGVIHAAAAKCFFWKCPIEAARVLFVNVHKLPYNECYAWMNFIRPTHPNYKAWVDDFCHSIPMRNKHATFNKIKNNPHKKNKFDDLLRSMSAPYVELIELDWVEVRGVRWAEYKDQLVSQVKNGNWMFHGPISVEHRGFLNSERIGKAKTGTVKIEYVLDSVSCNDRTPMSC